MSASGGALRRIAAVVGSSRASAYEVALAEALGVLLVDRGFRVLTGGLGGVMSAALRGARLSANYREGDTVAVLPGYDGSAASEHADVLICTGLNHARNVVVAASASVVLAIGGRAGTLNELAIAWELGRPVIVVGTGDGWANRLAGTAIDDRYEQAVHGPLEPEAAVALAVGLALHTRAAPSFA